MTDVVSKLSRELGQSQLESSRADALSRGLWTKPHTSATSTR